MTLAYWYQPKGLAVTVESVGARLKILKEFEHEGAWRDLQSSFVKRLNEEGVSKAEDEWDSGGAPLARMLKQVMVVLGLAWVDPDDQIEITQAGNLFLDTADATVLARQAIRYQFWNPAIASTDHAAIRLHPVPFLVRLLQAVGGYISRVEYRLFASKARRVDDVDNVAVLIDEFRDLSPEEQSELVRQCDAYGGIDGYGVLRMNLISFQVLFQCKRWAGSVSAGTVRDFRGAMQGRADKGLIITTGTFTPDARREATRDGAPAIDLIDGEALVSLLKSFNLGVRVEQVVSDEVTIDEAFFQEL